MSLVLDRKPKIESDIATYICSGDLTKSVAQEYVTRISQHLHILRGLHIKGLLFSFKNVVKIEKDALIKIIEAFTEFHVSLRTFAGFCEYNNSQFNILLHSIKDTPLGLFKTPDIMALAVGTSNLYNNSSILVHTEDPSDSQAIASILISNNYFVVMAHSKEDFKSKIAHSDRFDRVISHSYFGNMHEDIIVTFEHNIFLYECKGVLNASFGNAVKKSDFEYRLSLGYKVFVFDLTHIFHMDKSAAYIFYDLEEIAVTYGAHICMIGVNPAKLDSNALAILKKRELWIYEHIDDLYEDEDIIELTASRKVKYIQGISKELIAFTPHLITASMQSLQIFQIRNPEKSPSSQSDLLKLESLKPIITTHIAFHGDYEGELFFLFTQESSEILLQNIIGDIDDMEGDDLLDAMSEFVNSVTGKIKSNLKKKHKSVQFSLPQSSAVLLDFIADHLDNKAILTTFKCDGNPYYVALSSALDR